MASHHFLITADASKPAPEFRELLHRLANPEPYAGMTPQLRAACERIDAAFGKKDLPPELKRTGTGSWL
jgi:hypothetical protein